MGELTAEKQELRRQVREMRRRQDGNILRRDSEALCARLLELPELQCARWVFCYVSCKGEVETHGLLKTLLAQGKRVAVPRCGANGAMDCVEIRGLEDLQPGKMGIPEPPPEAAAVPVEEIGFAVVPALACGQDGSRLGQGGGYYDRFLERYTGPFAAVCLERFLFPDVPMEAHDRKMKLIVTQHRVLHFEEL